MSDDRYKLIFTRVVEGTDPEEAKAAIQERFQIQISAIEKWFGKEHALVKQNLTEDQAWKLQYVLETMGVMVTVVLQTRSNLKLENLSMESAPVAAQAAPALQFKSYQPNGIAEFDAKPLSGQAAVSRASAKRRQATQRGAAEGRSFKLTHMIAA
ncbi:MAG: hypothetical protein MI867_29620, partial [Pseudomonadales bacterium]|nr:hypothetical protein [Pseudomonadales bacterium]